MALLLRLPAEIRNKIWTFALKASEGESFDIYRVEPLTQTCRQTRKECLLLSYFCQSSVTAVIKNSRTQVLVDWIKQFPERAEQIQLLHIISETDVEHELDEGAPARKLWDDLVKFLQQCDFKKDRLWFSKKYTSKDPPEWMPMFHEILLQSRIEKMMAEREGGDMMADHCTA